MFKEKIHNERISVILSPNEPSVEGYRVGMECLDTIINKYAPIRFIAILPDFHFKARMEVPSSVTFAVEDHICFSLSSPEQNCGMTIALTPVLKEELPKKYIKKFFLEMRQRVPLPSLTFPKLDKKEVLGILRRGAKWSIDRFGLNPSLAQFIENRGSLFPEEMCIDFADNTIIPEELIDIARHIFCHIGDGNHFLEMQYVDRIIDPTVCDLLGIGPGQICIMYHSGSGYFGSMLGRYYAHRTKNTLMGHLGLFFRKMHFHLSNIPQDSSMLERIRRYLLWRKFVFIPAASSEGKRASLAIKASMNYGYANRMAVFSEVGHVFERLLGVKKEDLSIFWDYSHNSIGLEEFKGNCYWMHRHNTCRIVPKNKLSVDSVYCRVGQPVFVPGFNTTSSFIGIAGSATEVSLNSIDHGAGNSIKNYCAKGLSQEVDKGETLIFNYKSDSYKVKKHLSDEGISSVIGLLADKHIMRPIARLRPIAALKG